MGPLKQASLAPPAESWTLQGSAAAARSFCACFTNDLPSSKAFHGMQASPEAAQYETLGREDDALLVKMLAAGLPKLPAGQCAQMLATSKLSHAQPEHHAVADTG